MESLQKNDLSNSSKDERIFPMCSKILNEFLKNKNVDNQQIKSMLIRLILVNEIKMNPYSVLEIWRFENPYVFEQQLQENNNGIRLLKEEEINIVSKFDWQIPFKLKITQNEFFIILNNGSEIFNDILKEIEMEEFNKLNRSSKILEELAKNKNITLEKVIEEEKKQIKDSIEYLKENGINLLFSTKGSFKQCSEIIIGTEFTPNKKENEARDFDLETGYGFILNKLIVPALNQLAYNAYVGNYSPEMLLKFIRGDFNSIINYGVSKLLNYSLNNRRSIPKFTLENLLGKEIVTIFKKNFNVVEVTEIAKNTENFIVLKEIANQNRFNSNINIVEAIFNSKILDSQIFHIFRIVLKANQNNINVINIYINSLNRITSNEKSNSDVLLKCVHEYREIAKLNANNPFIANECINGLNKIINNPRSDLNILSECACAFGEIARLNINNSNIVDLCFKVIEIIGNNPKSNEKLLLNCADSFINIIKPDLINVDVLNKHLDSIFNIIEKIKISYHNICQYMEFYFEILKINSNNSSIIKRCFANLNEMIFKKIEYENPLSIFLVYFRGFLNKCENNILLANECFNFANKIIDYNKLSSDDLSMCSDCFGAIACINSENSTIASKCIDILKKISSDKNSKANILKSCARNFGKVVTKNINVSKICFDSLVAIVNDKRSKPNTMYSCVESFAEIAKMNVGDINLFNSCLNILDKIYNKDSSDFSGKNSKQFKNLCAKSINELKQLLNNKECQNTEYKAILPQYPKSNNICKNSEKEIQGLAPQISTNDKKHLISGIEDDGFVSKKQDVDKNKNEHIQLIKKNNKRENPIHDITNSDKSKENTTKGRLI